MDSLVDAADGVGFADDGRFETRVLFFSCEPASAVDFSSDLATSMRSTALAPDAFTLLSTLARVDC